MMRIFTIVLAAAVFMAVFTGLMWFNTIAVWNDNEKLYPAICSLYFAFVTARFVK